MAAQSIKSRNSTTRENMTRFSKYTTLFALACTATMITSVQASAQAKINARASGWIKTCNEGAAGEVCNVQYQVVSNDGQILTAVSLVELSGDAKRRIFRIVVPTGRSLQQGVQLQVDGKQATAVPYAFCRPRICAAEAALTDDLVKIFKAGGSLEITSINFQGQPNPIPVTLKGFTAAYDGPPTEIPKNDAQESQEKLKKQLEEKLKSGEIKAD